MNEGTPSQPTQPTPKLIAQPLAGHDFLYYWRHLRLPLLVAVALSVVLSIFNQRMVYIIFLELIYLMFISWFMVKRKHSTRAQSIVMGTIAGLILGLVLSIFKLFYFWKLFLFFNIITETLVTGLAGMLAGAALYTILHRQTNLAQSLLPDRDHQPTPTNDFPPKGGENDGHTT